MRIVHGLFTSAVVCAGCPAPSELCGLSTVAPTDDDVADGSGAATRSDGVAFEGPGTWSPSSMSIVIETLDMIASADEAGSSVADLIEAAAFPICVPIRDRSETSGSAFLADGAFTSDADHRGGVAILGRDGDTLIGRFGFELVNPQGTTLTFSDGVFRVPSR